MNISTNHYKLRKVKKRWVTFVVTTMAGLTLMTAGASSASADSSTLDSQVNQTSTLVQPTSDGTSVVAPSQEKVPSNPTEVKDTDNQSENQSQPTQAASLTTQEDDKEPTSQNNQAPADSPKQVKEPTSVAPASDGAVVQQDPQTQKQEEKTTGGKNEVTSTDAVVTTAPTLTSDDQRADINKILDGRLSGISTLDAAALTYEFEKARLKGATDATILAKIQEAGRVIPNNLTYLSDFYDNQTGTSGTAFRDKASNKVIIAYTGTNNDGNELQDALGADLMGIGLARGQHYQPAYDFYDKIASQYGAEIIVITGHSLGGNVAQRVALKKNAATTVVYNSAPLYIPALASVGNKIYESLRKNFDLPSNRAEAKKTIAAIRSDMKTFTGHVIRITTTKDWLNNAMRWLGAVYLGKEYVIPDSGNHDLQPIAENAKQVASVKQWTTI